MAKILGFLIDPEAETITEVEFASGARLAGIRLNGERIEPL